MENEKAVYIASSANIVGVKIIKKADGNYDVSVDLKSGGVAPGINNAIPEEGFKKAGWLGIMESPGPENTDEERQETNVKKELMVAALRDWETRQGIPEGLNEFLFVDKDTFDDFYKGATNGIIWPLIHSMPEKVAANRDLNTHTPVNWEYTETLLEKINEDIADTQKPKITNYNDVVVWAHDYHVFQVPGMLKNAIKEQNAELIASNHPELVIEGDINVAFFHHETWPNLDRGVQPKGEVDTDKVYFGKNEEMQDRFKDILTNLIQADSLGFHTQGDADNFVKTVENFDVINGVEAKERLKKKCFANPIGIPKARLEQELLDRVPVLKGGLNAYDKIDEKFYKDLKKAAGELGEILLEQFHDSNTTLLDTASNESTIQEAKEKIRITNKLNASRNTILKGNASLHDYQSVTTGKYFDPEKVHMASVSRFDYTKGIKEFLEAYQTFLTDKQIDAPNLNPGDKYQFNLVTGAGRSSPIPAYEQYAVEVKKLIGDINRDFPGAIHHYPDGINNSELPIFNAMNDLEVAASVKDGYILSVGEMIDARNRVLQHEDVDTLLTHRPTGTIISNGAGITEDLGGIERQSTLSTLSIVHPTPQALKVALVEQVERIEHLRALRVLRPNLAGFQGKRSGNKKTRTTRTELAKNERHLKEMTEKITDADTKFGRLAFSEIAGRPLPVSDKEKDRSKKEALALRRGINPHQSKKKSNGLGR